MKKHIALLMTTLLLASCSKQTTPETPSKPIRDPRVSSQALRMPVVTFQVRGSTIYDLNNQPFTVRGAGVLYHTFMGMDDGGYGISDLQHLPEQLTSLKQMGVNLVRIFVTASILDLTPLPGTKPTATPYPRLETLKQAVDTINREGMVALIANSYSDDPNLNVQVLKLLASTFRGNSLVWLTPMNEPNCAVSEFQTGDPPHCGDWDVWRTQQNLYIKTIRDQRFVGPLLINGVAYSQDLTRVSEGLLSDPVNNLIFGAHRYGDDHVSFTAAEEQEVQQLWANITRYPVVLDEVGADNGEDFLNSPEWTRGFMEFACQWTQHQGGDGAIAFTSYTSDGNSLFEDAGYDDGNEDDIPSPVLPLVLTEWGNTFFEKFVFPVKTGLPCIDVIQPWEPLPGDVIGPGGPSLPVN